MSEFTDLQIADLMEQFEAAKHVITSYRCCSCNIASAQIPIIVAEDTEEGCRVRILGICHTCAESESDDELLHEA